jgi:tRNA-dihydrouridine synthase
MPDHPTKSFWQSRPLLVLAPMEDVTDTAFRELVIGISAPDMLHVVFTEFTSTDGLCHPKGRQKVEFRLKVSHSERQLLQAKGVKIVAQVWGNKPEKFQEAISYINQNHAFDGIDINMGCPVKKVVVHGSCSALIANEPLAAEIIAASREATDLPLSVKTRTGIKQADTERWIGFLLEQPLDAITIHGRTQKQQSEGIADWHEIERAVALRDQLAPHIAIIGNGDVESVAEAIEKIRVHRVDGVMIGRGIFKNPWLFDPRHHGRRHSTKNKHPVPAH